MRKSLITQQANIFITPNVTIKLLFNPNELKIYFLMLKSVKKADIDYFVYSVTHRWSNERSRLLAVELTLKNIVL